MFGICCIVVMYNIAILGHLYCFDIAMCTVALLPCVILHCVLSNIAISNVALLHYVILQFYNVKCCIVLILHS